VLVSGSAFAQTTQPQSLLHKQEAQQQVRAMARDLVAAILDVQLVGLEENELTATELYREIRAMRGHLDELIDAEMPQVLALLAKIQDASAGEREKTFVAARQKSREILVQLLVERQVVLRRLRIAEMAAQVRQLIRSQTKVLEVTESLPEQPSGRRDALTLSAIEDERDVKAVYTRLHATIEDVGTWGGEVGTLASRALKMLRQAKIDGEMDAVGQSLQQTRFADAAVSERNVLKALRELLDILEKVQGLMKKDRQAAEQAVRELVDRQREVRQATSQSDPNDRNAQQLVQQQSQIQKDAAKLSKDAQPVAEAAKPLEEAAKTAEEATAKLFEGKQAEALAEQDKVLENLNKAAEAMHKESGAEKPASPADKKPLDEARAARAIADLEAARQDLQRIQKEQEAASATAAKNPAAAKSQETQIAQHLGDVPKNRQLPEPVTARTADAQQAATTAASRMESPEAQRRTATRQAEQAIQQALSEAERALADARREALRDKISALADAAQTVEKAAATERHVGQQAEQAAQKNGLEKGAASDLGQKQSGVQQAAARAADQVRQAAPEAAKTLAEAAPPIQQAAQALQAAERTPGEASKPAAAEAAKQAQQAAGKLTQAAEQLRRETAETAARLSKLTNQQVQQAHQALEGVENAIAGRPESLAKRLEKLAQAEEHVQKAQVEQQKATGGLSQFLRQEATKMGLSPSAVAAGRPEPPAAKPEPPAQARVGQEIAAAKELAQPDAPKAAKALAEAAKSSEAAQREAAPAGNPQEAAKAQASTAEALRHAAGELADAKKELAGQMAPQMTAEARAAARLADQATPVDPGATGALHSAENKAGEAAREVPKAPDRALPAERDVGAAMERAAADLAARLRQLLGDRAFAQAAAAQAKIGAKASPPPGEQRPAQAIEGGTSQKRLAAQNPPAIPRPVRAATPDPKADSRSAMSDHPDSEAGRREAEEPWIAKLPPEIRAAIRANSQRRPPRGYEERLQRYYKNIE
jgi:hypothetical protein